MAKMSRAAVPEPFTRGFDTESPWLGDRLYQRMSDSERRRVHPFQQLIFADETTKALVFLANGGMRF